MIEANNIFNSSSNNTKNFFKLNMVLISKFIVLFFFTTLLIIFGVIYYSFYRYTPFICIDESNGLSENAILQEKRVYKGILLSKSETEEILIFLQKRNINHIFNKSKNTLDVKITDLDSACDIYIYEYKKYSNY